MYFETTKTLDNKNTGLISYNNPIAHKHILSHVSLLRGKSKTSIFKRCQVSKCVIASNNANDEASNDKTLDRVLGILDKNFSDSLFNHAVNTGCYSKKTSNMITSLY